MLACWKRSNRCGSSLPVGSCVYLWIGWMLHRLGNRKLLLCSPGGLEERNGMLLRCLYKLREATLIEGTSCLSSCWQQNSFTIWWYWLVIISTSTNFHVFRGGCSSIHVGGAYLRHLCVAGAGHFWILEPFEQWTPTWYFHRLQYMCWRRSAPICSLCLGDGHQPNSRGQYTQSKDSLLKVGWPLLTHILICHN